MNLERKVGLSESGAVVDAERRTVIRALMFKLAALGFRVPDAAEDRELLEVAGDLFDRFREQRRLLSEHLPPADSRIQAFLDQILGGFELDEPVRLPASTLVLDRYGLARELSLPYDADEWHNDHVSSYRLDNGVLHNPVNDRRTTKGVFHVADVGLPVPADKIKVPLIAYANLLKAAFSPPAELSRLPFTANWPVPVEGMVSLLLRPLVCPEVPGHRPKQQMEIRFFAPGGLVSNLDFVESIFGNAGDPYLPDNDAALDVDHWTGHTGCVVLAPHLLHLTKKSLGLPHVDDATEEQRATGMCWLSEHEAYNSGKPFKITLRDGRGIMVTILADNYFGYCKKEVKTQIGLSANLSGLAEEEHAGGALAFSSYSLGLSFLPDARTTGTDHRFVEAMQLLGDSVEVQPEGYAIDRLYPSVFYMPEDMQVDLSAQDVKWTHHGTEQHLKLLPDNVYIHPSGYKVRMEKHPAAPTYRLVGTVAEGTFCHKPSTVSGGGKSEISKSLVDAVLYGPIYVNDFEKDIALAKTIIDRDYGDCLRPEMRTEDRKDPGRAILSSERSLGSVVKLLTQNPTLYTDEYNEWLGSIPNHVRAIVFVIKRFHRPDWGDDWLQHFSVDIIDGAPGHELKSGGRKLVGSYLRVGLWKNGLWRTYKLRQDFMAAKKVQMEDDITVSVVVPKVRLHSLPKEFDHHSSLKLSENCEYRLFQRPDEAVNPGYDKQAEQDIAGPGLFASNLEAHTPEALRELEQNVFLRDSFTAPMREHISKNSKRATGFSVCSAKPRLVGGKPTKNPRYLQVRPDLSSPREGYIARVGTRLYRKLPAEQPVVFPVASVLSGRRNNPPEEGIRPLCVYNPVHYQETPELFMDYICSVTGKSPSTTGAGSEGALTKGPFNAICATADLNNMLVGMLLCEYPGFSTAAGYIGPNYRVDHDISLLVPEIWCRLFPEERDPKRMIAQGHLEKLEDFEYEGKKVLASRLGYRITEKFVHTFFGRIFDNPAQVFSTNLLRPETQDLAVFVDGVNNICEAYQRAALLYFQDGSIEDACPPLQALLHIMAYGHFENKDVDDPAIRSMFTRRAVLESEWYRERLRVKQARDVELWQQHVRNLKSFLSRSAYAQEAERLGIAAKLAHARGELERVSSPSYVSELQGTIGADPIHRSERSRLSPKVARPDESSQQLTN